MARVLLYDHMRCFLRRLPQHYKDRYLEANAIKTDSTSGDNEKLVRDKKTGEVYPASYYDVPLNVIYPPESQKCMWGGEGIIKGYGQKNTRSPLYPKTWSPNLMEHIFYSEILDRWMIIIVSDTALQQIETKGGFDNYILATPERELKSRLAMHLKREMLITLAKITSIADRKREDLVKKYGSFIIPLEEAEWIGLTLEEALKKQIKLEHQAKQSQIRPMKLELADKFIDRLQNPPTEDVEEEKEEEKTARESPGFFSRLMYGDKSQV